MASAPAIAARNTAVHPGVWTFGEGFGDTGK